METKESKQVVKDFSCGLLACPNRKDRGHCLNRQLEDAAELGPSPDSQTQLDFSSLA